MSLLTLAILALIQGITEFLPISSSGHLLLAHSLLNEQNTQDVFQENLLIDVAVHVGTLFSVLIYFWRDVNAMLCGIVPMLKGKKTAGSKLNIYLLVSSIPVIAVGFAMHLNDFYWGHAYLVVAWTTLIFGIVLWVVDATKPNEKELKDMTIIHALVIGIAQALALVPGTSRSGITMTAARYLGYSRTEAARYSLLLAIIAISGAGVLLIKDLIGMEDITFTTDLLIAALLAFISGLAAISLMMKWLAKASFKIFGIYRIILGIALLIIGYEFIPL